MPHPGSRASSHELGNADPTHRCAGRARFSLLLMEVSDADKVEEERRQLFNFLC